MVAFRLEIKAGDWIADRYHVLDALGEGSYGDVFKVRDAEDNGIYALKLLRLWEIPSDLHNTLIEKFKQEFQASRISSEYLIHCSEHGVVKGNPYIVMEYCPAGDLSKKTGISPSLASRYAGDILEGLHALHMAGKVHRDLKPENVLIKNNGHAALTDFGIIGEMNKAKRKSEVGFLRKKPMQAIGTPLYMSPEMFNREGGGVTYLPTVDIWSFGVMMYELLTSGMFPFGNIESETDLPIYQSRAKRGEWNAGLLEDITGWKEIIGKCLAPDFRSRYQNALEVMQDLRPMIGNAADRYTQEDRLSRSTNISGLLITQGNNLGKSYILKALLSGYKRMIKVGRTTDNDVVLCEEDSMYVSRHHFTIERAPDGQFWTIYDGQWNINERRWVTSTNGTYLNSMPVPPKGQGGLRLFRGDIITVGEYKLKVE